MVSHVGETGSSHTSPPCPPFSNPGGVPLRGGPHVVLPPPPPLRRPRSRQGRHVRPRGFVHLFDYFRGGRSLLLLFIYFVSRPFGFPLSASHAYPSYYPSTHTHPNNHGPTNPSTPPLSHTEQIQWCREHDTECRAIACNAQRLYDAYCAQEGILDYLQLVTHKAS